MQMFPRLGTAGGMGSSGHALGVCRHVRGWREWVCVCTRRAGLQPPPGSWVGAVVWYQQAAPGIALRPSDRLFPCAGRQGRVGLHTWCGDTWSLCPRACGWGKNRARAGCESSQGWFKHIPTSLLGQSLLVCSSLPALQTVDTEEGGLGCCAPAVPSACPGCGQLWPPAWELFLCHARYLMVAQYSNDG